MIRKLAAGLAACFAVALFSGCSASRSVNTFYPHSRAETFGQEGKDHHQSILQITRWDERSLIEDLDLFFMTDRSSRLTRYHTK